MENTLPRYFITENNQPRLKQEYIFAYSYHEGFSEHLLSFELLLTQDMTCTIYSSGFKLENKVEVLVELPQSIYNFFIFLDENPLPFSDFSFNYPFSITDNGGQNILINWNDQKYSISIEGKDMDAFIYDCEWKQKFKELNEFLLKFCELKLKEKYFNKR